MPVDKCRQSDRKSSIPIPNGIIRIKPGSLVSVRSLGGRVLGNRKFGLTVSHHNSKEEKGALTTREPRSSP